MIDTHRSRSPWLALDDVNFSDLAAEVAPISREVGRRAAQLRAAHPSLRLPDALVLATGDVLEAAAVLTTDRRWSRYGRRVRVIRAAPNRAAVCGWCSAT